MRVEVHWLFLLVLLVATLAGFQLEALILLGSLIAHEIAHLLVAWVLGLGVEELILTPFGGMARLDTSLETDPQAETSVALAGPFQSFFLAGLAVFLMGADLFDRQHVRFFYEVNANLAFFNLIPALPMDGGRALRGLLAQRWGYRRVTRWMLRVGRVSVGRDFGVFLSQRRHGIALFFDVNPVVLQEFSDSRHRNREPDPLTVCELQRVDSNHPAVLVEQRAAAVPRVDRCIGLDEAALVEDAVLGGQDAFGQRIGHVERRADRIDIRPDSKFAVILHCKVWQRFFPDVEHREVEGFIQA
jgi:Zn-dependent protease